ncbi:predicted protein [Nematostella vectensis]|uniref:G-protein coupled receptors family 1 profile domain-containing protein n=1 Tax=Nematostella vectensis TaxID=45351 RepID=A7RRX7_NEMVE|nr:predicted protein [Nematostella vectensis]|eukprot:XP_001637901.1 predicted protein [Nematostella vectensis]
MPLERHEKFPTDFRTMAIIKTSLSRNCCRRSLWNVATVITFITNAHLPRSGVYCLINLAVADASHGASSVFWYFLYFDSRHRSGFVAAEKEFKNSINVVAGVINTTAVITSLLSLLLVSLDRACSTVLPYVYRKLTVKIYCRGFVMTWLFAVGLAAIPSLTIGIGVYGHDVWLHQSGQVISIIALAIIAVSYMSIFVKIRQQNSRHQNQRLDSNVRRSQKKERYLAVTLFIVTVLSLAAWLPFIIVHEVGKVSNAPRGFSQNHIELLTEIIQLTNSLVNPTVYVFRMEKFRRALIELLTKCKRARPHPRPRAHLEPASPHPYSHNANHSSKIETRSNPSED